MATYKVLQDIEAEDKFLGPLTLKQFIYAAIAAICAYLSFLAVSRGVGYITFIFLPFIIITGFFAWPWSRDQPTEIWALAKIRFMLKPHRRIWNQSGVKEMVTITVPKKIERILSKNFSETEVRSRLEALANTIDSRGWAVKNVNVNLYSQPGYETIIGESDRLVALSSLPRNVVAVDIHDTDDILDEHTSPTAQHFDQMIAASAQTHKQQITDQMKQFTQLQNNNNPIANGPPPDYWFMRGDPASTAKIPAGQAVFQKSQVVIPGADDAASHTQAQPTADDQKILEKIHMNSKPSPAYGHMRTIKPLSEQNKPSKTASGTVTNSSIIEFANNDDLNIATIARQADKANKKEPPQDEVVISLR